MSSPEHPLNREVAQRVVLDLETPYEFIKTHQDALLPLMRREVLEALRGSPPGWLDRDRIEAEMARRDGG